MEELVQLEVPMLRHPEVVLRGLGVVTAVAQTDLQCLSGLSAVLRCCFPDKRCLPLGLAETMSSLYDAPLLDSTEAFQILYEELKSQKKSQEYREILHRHMHKYLRYVLSRTTGRDTLSDAFYNAVLEYFASTSPIVQLAIHKVLWLRQDNDIPEYLKARISDVMLRVLAFFEIMARRGPDAEKHLKEKKYVFEEFSVFL